MIDSMQDEQPEPYHADSPGGQTGQAADSPSGVSIGQAAAELGLSVNATRHRVKRGTLPAFKLSNGEWRVLLPASRPGQAARPRPGDAADRPPDYPATSAQQQLDLISESLLRPHLELIERQAARIAALEHDAGRLAAELEMREQTIAALQTELATRQDAPGRRVSALEQPQDESVQRAPQPRPTAVQRVWWRVWRRG